MSTTIILNDHVNNRRSHLVFILSDYDTISEFWYTKDNMLKELQGNKVFSGYERWCDLEPKHFRLLLMQTLYQIDNLTIDDIKNEHNTYIKSLNFLLLGFCHCLSQRVQGEVDIVNIHRITATEITYEVTTSLIYLDTEGISETENTEKKEKVGFKIVVDNTPNEDD